MRSIKQLCSSVANQCIRQCMLGVRPIGQPFFRVRNIRQLGNIPINACINCMLGASLAPIMDESSRLAGRSRVMLPIAIRIEFSSKIRLGICSREL